MNLFKKITYLVYLFILLFNYYGYGQKTNKVSLGYQIDLGVSKLYHCPNEIYFQSGNNINACLEIQLKLDSINFFGLQAGIGQVRYFTDASIIERKLTPSNTAAKQQDFGIALYRLNFSYERVISRKLLVRASSGLIYYGLQTVGYKLSTSNQIITEKNHLNFLKPISEIGIVYNIGGKPNLKVGYNTRVNLFSKNFENANPVDFNLFIRFTML